MAKSSDPSIFAWLRRQPAEPTPVSRAARVAAAQPSAPRKGLRDMLGLRVKLERKGLDVSITLINEEQLAQERAANRAVPDKAASEALTLQLMQTQLSDFMRRHPESRSVLRHLAVFEQLLRKQGARAFTEPPVELLRTALQQLESLVTNWEQPGLAALRSRLSVVIVDRDRRQNPDEHAAVRSNFLDQRRLEVTEVSSAEFDRAEASWAAPPADAGGSTPR